MKKIIASLTILAMALSILGPALAGATVSTGLQRGAGGGDAPIVKVKWEMKTSTQGADDSTNAGAQFAAPGAWNNTLNYTVCAIATDPDGVANISGVYADIYYPSDMDGSYHIPAYNADPAKPDHVNGGVPGDPDYGIGGCDAFIEENTLVKMDKMAGYQLFCGDIRTNNNTLPVFATTPKTYTYDEICNQDGELMKEEAYVYCDAKTLKWEDPAGNYRVVVTALDKSGNNSAPLENHFVYLPLTSYEVDFTAVDYGQVLLDTDKKISGDLTFCGGLNQTTCGTTPGCAWDAMNIKCISTNPTVRNLGNTRLYMKIAQDDMALGQSSGVWNVKFDARVGNNAADWKLYNPFGPKGTNPGTYTQLQDILDLSEIEEMDFSIHIYKWPDTNTSYSGSMWLSATKAMFRVCSSF